MAFHIGFIQHIDAILIAQIVPVIIVGIMGSTDRVDIVLQHDADILLHHFPGESISVFGMGLMPVHTPEGNGNPVDADQILIICFPFKPSGIRGLISDLAESHLTGFVNRPVSCGLLNDQGI